MTGYLTQEQVFYMMFGDPVEIRDVAEVFEQSSSDGAARHDNQDSKRTGYSRRQELSPVAQDQPEKS